jgi:hypothetical protein
MSDRFAGLVKLPRVPARRLLADANVKLDTALESPASAGVEEVLAELEEKGEVEDMMLLLACALPARERVWWACLAARDVIDPKAKPPLSLTTSEAWVYEPTEANRLAARNSMDVADAMDDTTNCATAVLFFDGTLGPADLAEHPAPAGAAELSVWAMNMIAYGHVGEVMEEMGQVLVERALDIARGGSGQIPAPLPPEPEPEDEDDGFPEDPPEEEEEPEEEEDEEDDEDDDEDKDGKGAAAAGRDGKNAKAKETAT